MCNKQKTNDTYYILHHIEITKKVLIDAKLFITQGAEHNVNTNNFIIKSCLNITGNKTPKI